MEKKSNQRKLIWSWALYDWANSAFATTIIAGFFPVFFKKYWSTDFSALESTYFLGLMNSVSSFALALLAPGLGAIADLSNWRKKFLFLFTILGVLASIGLGLLGQGQWLWASLIFSIGMIGFNGGLTFYDALLMNVAPNSQLDRVSGFGYALGYLGGGILFALNVWMHLSPQTFGVSDGASAIKISFISVGIWWFVFSLPIFLFVPESQTSNPMPLNKLIKEGFICVFNGIKNITRHKTLLFFLLGFFFYNDAVNTIIKMAIDYGLSIGLETSDLIKALLLVQFIGFPAAIGFSFLAEKFGPQKGIWICLIVYLAVTIYAYKLSNTTEFFILAAVIGAVQGGVQALSRSYYARLVTPEESAQYFGFFNMMGKFSSILGPFMVGYVGLISGNSRLGILVLGIFFIIGGLFLFLSQRQVQGSR